jgi:hypothetical protein
LLGNQVFWSQPAYGPQMPVYAAPAVIEPDKTESAAVAEPEQKAPAKTKKKKAGKLIQQAKR